MLLLGISDSHDASIVLIDNTEIFTAVSEERFTRRKRQQGFPFKAIEYVKKNFDIKNELIAIDRFLEMKADNLYVFGVFLDNEIIAYSVNEICNSGFAIGHFYKANQYNGIFSYLMKESALFLSNFNLKRPSLH